MAIPVVEIEGNAYRVILSDKKHLVEKDKSCSCGMKICAGVAAVEDYLRAGGNRAPESLPPCPVCGGKTVRDRKWDGKHTKTLGWRCETGGLSHFLQAKAEHIKRNVNENPWLIPPVPGYAGILRGELLTFQQCNEASQRVFSETGYNPAA